MSEIEEFMAKQKLRRCAALCANITEQQCKINKKSGRVFSCDSCKGLEETDMTKKCNEPDFSNINWKAGKCYRHHPENIAKKEALEIRKIYKESAEVKPLPVIIECADPGAGSSYEAKPLPVASDHEIHIVNLMNVFRQKQAAELDAFAARLGQITDPVEKLLFTLKAVQA